MATENNEHKSIVGNEVSGNKDVQTADTDDSDSSSSSEDSGQLRVKHSYNTTPQLSANEIKTILKNLEANMTISNNPSDDHKSMESIDIFSEIKRFETTHGITTSNITNAANSTSDDDETKNDSYTDCHYSGLNSDSKWCVKETTTIKKQKHKKKLYINEYLLYKEVGNGSYGRVVLSKNIENNGKFAMKIINKYSTQQRSRAKSYGKKKKRLIIKKKKSRGDKNEANNGKKGQNSIATKDKNNGNEDGEFLQIVSEMAILKQLKHPNICQMYEIIDDPNKQHSFIILEYMTHGTLLS